MYVLTHSPPLTSPDIPLTHSLTHSLTHTHYLSHPFTHITSPHLSSLARTNMCTYWFRKVQVHSLTHSLAHILIHSLTQSINQSIYQSLAGSLTHSLMPRLHETYGWSRVRRTWGAIQPCGPWVFPSKSSSCAVVIYMQMFNGFSICYWIARTSMCTYRFRKVHMHSLTHSHLFLGYMRPTGGHGSVGLGEPYRDVTRGYSVRNLHPALCMVIYMRMFNGFSVCFVHWIARTSTCTYGFRKAHVWATSVMLIAYHFTLQARADATQACENPYANRP